MHLTKSCLLIAVACCCGVALHAQPNIQLNHDSSWHIQGREVTIRALEVVNVGDQDTGPLFLSIYARTGTGYDGVGSPGKLLARATIDPIPAGTSRQSIEVVTKLRAPAPKEQFTALAVEEKAGRAYTVLNYVIYTSTYTFPRRQNGGVGSDDQSVGLGDVAFHGNVSLTGVKRRGDFSIEKIQNHRDGIEATGPLRLAVYATREPADGSAPVLIATRSLGALAPGDFYHGLQGRLNLKRPGRGTFLLSLALEEDQGGGFQTLTSVPMAEPRQF